MAHMAVKGQVTSGSSYQVRAAIYHPQAKGKGATSRLGSTNYSAAETRKSPTALSTARTVSFATTWAGLSEQSFNMTLSGFRSVVHGQQYGRKSAASVLQPATMPDSPHAVNKALSRGPAMRSCWCMRADTVAPS